MESEDQPQPSTAGKIRVRAHGGRSRQRKPYQRREITVSKINETEGSQGLLSKVSNLIVPTWLTSWFSSTQTETPSDVSSEDSDSDVKESEGDTMEKVVPNFQLGNHVGHKKSLNVNNNLVVKQGLSQSGYSAFRSTQENLDNTVDEPTVKRDFSSTLIARQKRCRPNDDSFSNTATSGEETLHATMPDNSSLGTRDAFKLASFAPHGTTSIFGTPKPFAVKVATPGFKVSTFISSKSSESISNSSSPFYRGKTTFGGASSLRSPLTKRVRLSPVAAATQLPKTRVQARELKNKRKETVTGETARRILRALEKMSSPVQDTRRMPLKRNVVNSSKDSVLPNSSENLNSAEVISKTDILSKPTTDDTLLSQSKANLPSISTSFKPKGLPLSFSPEDCSTTKRQNFKMKRQKTYSHQPSCKTDETEDTSNLSAFPELTPFVVKKLPKFDFVAVSSAKTDNSETGENNASSIDIITLPPSTSQNHDTQKFSFAAPRIKSVLLQDDTPAELATRETFSFSKPLSVATIATSNGDGASMRSSKQNPASAVNTKLTSASVSKTESQELPLMSIGVNITPKLSPPKGSWECYHCLIKNKIGRDICSACGNERNSSRDALRKVNVETEPKKDMSTSGVSQPKEAVVISNNMEKTTNTPSIFAKFAPKPGSWECEVCLIRNDAEKEKCPACQAPKPSKVPIEQSKAPVQPNKSIFAKFAPKPGSWECEVCLIRNDAEKQKCPACQAPKPSKAPIEQSKAPVQPDKSIFAKFAPKPGSWECEVCLIRNDAEKQKCPACQAPKPSKVPIEQSKAPVQSDKSIFAKFAPKPGSWECEVCLIRNDADKEKCPACQAPKPSKALIEQSKAPVLPDKSILAKFAPKPGSWECEVCLIRNEAEKEKCPACQSAKPGASKNADTDEEKHGTQFKFGVISTTENQPKFSFGVATEASGGIKFGVPSAGDVKSSDIVTSFPPKPSSGSINFGSISSSDATKTSTTPFSLGIGSSQIKFGVTEPSKSDSSGSNLSSNSLLTGKQFDKINSSDAKTFGGFVAVSNKEPERQQQIDSKDIANQVTDSSAKNVTSITTPLSSISNQASNDSQSTAKWNNGLGGKFSFGSSVPSSDIKTAPTSAVNEKPAFQFTLPVTVPSAFPSKSTTVTPNLFTPPVNPTPTLSVPFGSIAEAAKGGFLQVPSTQPKQNNVATTSEGKENALVNSTVVANGPVSDNQGGFRFGESVTKNFSFTGTSTGSPFQALGVQASGTSSEGGLFNVGKGTSSKPIIEQNSVVTTSTPQSNLFGTAFSAPLATAQDTSKPAFGALGSSNVGLFGQPSNVADPTTKNGNQMLFNFGTTSSSSAFGGFNFTQPSSSASGSGEAKNSFGNLAFPSAVNDTKMGTFASSNSGGFDFSSSTLKPGGFNFVNSPGGSGPGLFNSGQGQPQSGSQPLFNVGTGAAPASAQTGGPRPQAMQGRRVKKATRRLRQDVQPRWHV